MVVLSVVPEKIDILVLPLVIFPNCVPSSFKIISAPPASSMISPATSTVKSPEDKSISVPSIVMLSTTTPALAVTTPATPSVLAISTAPSISTTSKLLVPSISISPEMSKLVPVSTPVTPKVPDIVWLPVTAKVVPSKVKLASPFNPLEPVAVVIRLLESFAIVIPADQDNTPDPFVVNCVFALPSAAGNW